MMICHELKLKSVQYRKKILQVIKQAGAGHTAGDLSCIDILNVLYNRILNVSPDSFEDPDRDRYIHSKGHSVEALYVVLADRGFFPEEELETLARYGSHFVGHPTRKVRGIEHNTGSLGHGLSVSVGLALAGKMDNRPYRVFTLLGDGELAEGTNWEACAAVLMQKGIHTRFRIVGIPDEYTVPGSQLEIFKHYGISAEALAQTAGELLEA